MKSAWCRAATRTPQLTVDGVPQHDMIELRDSGGVRQVELLLPRPASNA
jgi:hypothetical protein